MSCGVADPSPLFPHSTPKRRSRQGRVNPESRTAVWPNGLDPAPELLHGDYEPVNARTSNRRALGSRSLTCQTPSQPSRLAVIQVPASLCSGRDYPDDSRGVIPMAKRMAGTDKRDHLIVVPYPRSRPWRRTEKPGVPLSQSVGPLASARVLESRGFARR